MILFRKATINDLDRALKIYHEAIEKFATDKTFQWVEGYPPNEESFKNDLVKYNPIVATIDEEVVGVMTLILDGEEDYLSIEGEWLNDDKYLTIHRIAVSKDYYGKRVGSSLLDYAKEFALDNSLNNIRIDTHKNNIDMKKMLTRHGFSMCGVIKLRNKNNDLRDAYQLVIKNGKKC
jgi:ribosomal protein S18 acetylase RimI-like enzyme